MPRDVPSPLQVILDSGALKPALLVRVTLKSGQAYGYTSWDEPVTFDSIDYLPNEGISLSQISTSLGTTVDNSEVRGAAQDTRLSDDDFDAGAWRFAVFEILLIDMQDPSAGSIVLQSGGIGKIGFDDGQVSVELFGLNAKLKGASGFLAAKKCNCVKVGNGRCHLDLTGSILSGIHAGRPIQATRTVSVVSTQKQIDVSSESAASELYSLGTAEFLTGANAGLLAEIKQHTNVSGSARLVFRLPLPYAIAVGDQVKLTSGCNRKLKYDDANAVAEDRIGCTCEEFGNQAHHKGQHYLPGNNKIQQVSRATTE